MKLSDVIENDDNHPGSYAGVRFQKRTVNALVKYIEQNGIANPPDDFHTTLLYSRKHLPNYTPIKKYKKPLEGTFTEFDLFGKDKNVLVLRYSCPMLYQRHHKLMQLHGATYDFDTFEPHVTLSYNPGEVDLESLPPFKGKIMIAGEYYEDLDAD